MIAVAGASGKLGHLVTDHLLKRVPADQLVALARTPDKLASLAARGVQIRHADYTRRDTLPAALVGVTRLLLISTSGFDHRVDQHRVVIEAAMDARVAFLAYTSQLRTDESTVPVSAEHRITEDLIRESGIPYAFLRNGWYTENYTENLALPLAMGGFVGAAAGGRIAAATRADLAEAAAVVLTSPCHDRQTYELAGDEAFTMAELAYAVSDWSGRSLPYRDLAPAEYKRVLMAAGLPATFADFYVASDTAIARGDLYSDRSDLHRLIGRPTERLRETLDRMPRP
jgi:NAD(P)H dehydrogenase (quinone)